MIYSCWDDVLLTEPIFTVFSTAYLAECWPLKVCLNVFVAVCSFVLSDQTSMIEEKSANQNCEKSSEYGENDTYRNLLTPPGTSSFFYQEIGKNQFF